MSSDKPVPTKGELEKKTDSAEEESGGRGRLSWMLGWIALPGAVLGGLFGGGVLVGANFHDSWFTRAFVWIGELFF
ncbi:MAG: hypothetical protein ACRBN8_34625 [Nannocystales bacterium]